MSKHVDLHNQDTDPVATQLTPMRWFFFIVLVLWTFCTIALPVVLWCFTKNVFTLTSSAVNGVPGFLWYRWADYLLPMNEKRFQLKMAKIKQVSEKRRKQVS